jgi:glucosamine-6-phosphate deaminase
MAIKVTVTDNYDELSNLAAGKVAQLVKSKPGKPGAVLGLPTGSTPLGMYRQLISMYQDGSLSFRDVSTFNLDEYVGLSPDNENSYHFYMQQNFFKHVDIKQHNINIPDSNAADVEAECAEYERKIETAGGIDLMVLGLGNNGHIGFNEPDSHFPARTHKVKLDESTIQANARFFSSIDEVPRFAVTMGIGSIMRCRSIMLLASGKAKAPAVKGALEGPITPALPASALQFHMDVTVILDKDAASLLKSH